MKRFNIYYTETICIEVQAKNKKEAIRIFERGEHDCKEEVVSCNMDSIEEIDMLTHLGMIGGLFPNE